MKRVAFRKPDRASSGASRPLSTLLVDPSLFTGAYDLALTEGLEANGVSVRWATRPLRPGETCEIPADLVEPVFYLGASGSAKIEGKAAQVRKGMSHLRSLRRLIALRDRLGPDIVHFQWILLPVADSVAIRRLRRETPVVITVHDTTPFNGAPTSRLQLLGYGAVLRLADRLVVHTRQGREALVAAGCAPERICVIPHGPLRLGSLAEATDARPTAGDGRWTVVLFGKLQAYKGIDLLLEALGRLDEPTRARLRVIVAGEPLIAMTALQDRAARPDLRDCVEFRPWRHSEPQMQALFNEADAFVFPYRQIDASGVFQLVRSMGKWIVASDLGAFSDEVSPVRGALVAPGDAPGLAAALAGSIGRIPDPAAAPGIGWREIGARLRTLYADVLAERGGVAP